MKSNYKIRMFLVFLVVFISLLVLPIVSAAQPNLGYIPDVYDARASIGLHDREGFADGDGHRSDLIASDTKAITCVTDLPNWDNYVVHSLKYEWFIDGVSVGANTWWDGDTWYINGNVLFLDANYRARGGGHGIFYELDASEFHRIACKLVVDEAWSGSSAYFSDDSTMIMRIKSACTGGNSVCPPEGSVEYNDIFVPSELIGEGTGHYAWHDADDIKVKLSATDSTSLQSWIEDVNDDWDDTKTVWHDAEDINVEIGVSSYSLQEAIDDDLIGGGEEPIIEDDIIKDGDIITLKHETLGKFLSINSDGTSTKNGLNANRDNANTNREKFKIEEMGDSDGIIEHDDKVKFTSNYTGEKVRYLKKTIFRWTEWLHAKESRQGEIFTPKIKRATGGDSRIRYGDEVYFRDGVVSIYFDVSTSNILRPYRPAHRGSGRNVFIICDAEGDCRE